MKNNTNHINSNNAQNNGTPRSRRRPDITNANAQNLQKAKAQAQPPQALPVRRTVPQRGGQSPASQSWQEYLRPEQKAQASAVRRAPRPAAQAPGQARRRPPQADGEDNSKTRISAAIPALETGAPRRRVSAPAEEEKGRKKSVKRGGAMMSGLMKGIIYIVMVLVISGFSAYFIITVSNDVFAFVKPTDIYQIEVPESADIDTIAKILKEYGIIQYPSVFKLYGKYKKFSGEFVPGVYDVNPSMNYDELLKAFKPKKIRETVWVTIPEGYTVDEIINLFVSKGIGTREGFVEAINNYDYDYKFLEPLADNLSPHRSYRLEGYLFPDTYQFYTDSSEVEVIKRFLSNFDRKFNQAFYARAEELGLTVDQVIILASMIQEEAKFLVDYELISAVFHNRLRDSKNYPYFQCDATILYGIQIATGERPKTLTDTNYDTPYNTYLHKGFSPGPIANPGYDAIYCALYPAQTKDYYFVTDSEGTVYYAKTLAEHNANIQKVRAQKTS